MIDWGGLQPWFAKFDIQVEGQPLGKMVGLLLEHVLLIVAIALALLLVLLIWARYIRSMKLKKRRPDGQKVYRESGARDSREEDLEEAPDEEPDDHRKRYKYRWRRRRHRSRNPTLAETGGLPPLRSEEKPGSS